MKSLLASLIMLMGVSANAGTAAYNQLVAGLYGPNCLNTLEAKLKEAARPSWYDTFVTFGAADVEAYAIRDAIAHNVKVYKTALNQIRKNLNKGESNAYIYASIAANMKKKAQGSDIEKAVAYCVNPYLVFNGSTTQQYQVATTGLNIISRIEKAGQ
jgi:hypothetical protein